MLWWLQDVAHPSALMPIVLYLIALMDSCKSPDDSNDLHASDGYGCYMPADSQLQNIARQGQDEYSGATPVKDRWAWWEQQQA